MKEKHGIKHGAFAQICQKTSNMFAEVGKNFQICSDMPGLALYFSLFIFLYLLWEGSKGHASVFHYVHLNLNTWKSGTETQG